MRARAQACCRGSLIFYKQSQKMATSSEEKMGGVSLAAYPWNYERL